MSAEDNEFRSPGTPQTPPSTPTSLIIWLMVAALVVLAVPLLLSASIINDELVRLELQLESMSTRQPTAPAPTARTLPATLDALQGLIREVEAVRPTLTSGYGGADRQWRPVMAAISDYDVTQLRITGLRQIGHQVRLDGQAVHEEAVTLYARKLEESGRFSQVRLSNVRPYPTSEAPLALVTDSSEESQARISVTPDADPEDALPAYVDFTILLEVRVTGP